MPGAKAATMPKPAMTLAEMLRQDQEAGHDDAPVEGLPPTSAPFQQSARTGPVADLTRLAKVWALIGAGGGGKSTIARWLGGELAERGMLDRTLLAALDPMNRTLAQFFEAVMTPPSSDPAETEAWLRKMLEFVTKQRLNGVLDFGGGDTSLARLVQAAPTVADQLEEAGVGLIAAYVLTPRLDDLASLVTFEGAGFRPKATALILNLGRAETPAAFDAVRRQPVYKAALARGAVELWMPALEPQNLALRIERGRIQFVQARDGVSATGAALPAVGGLERVLVREWLERMDAEFAAVRSWLPWE